MGTSVDDILLSRLLSGLETMWPSLRSLPSPLPSAVPSSSLLSELPESPSLSLSLSAPSPSPSHTSISMHLHPRRRTFL